MSLDAPQNPDPTQGSFTGTSSNSAYTLPDGTPTYNYDWNSQQLPQGAIPYSEFDANAYLQARPDITTNAGYMGQGNYGDDYSLTPFDTVYAHYLGRDAFDPSISVENRDFSTQYRLPQDQIDANAASQVRIDAIQPYLDANGVLPSDLLGGQYTDPATIPADVVAERARARANGYMGEWGSGGASAYDQYGYKGSVDAYGRTTIKGFMEDEYLNPSLKPGTEFSPTLIQERDGQFLNANNYLLDPAAVEAQLTQAKFNRSGDVDKTAAAGYDATQVNITPEATVQGQLAELYKQFEGGEIPAWAAGAIRTAEQAMASRGMGASSIASQAIVQAAMEAATPIAQADAAVHAQKLFTNAAAINAAKQFNAANLQQNNQFFAGLRQQNEQFNADQQNALERFNAGEANAISKFNAQVRNQREQFNANNRIQIDQSNAVWRRQIDTTNTAATNAANQFNAANLLAISNTAMNNLWQEWRDMADYAFTASENDKARDHDLARLAVMNEQWFAQFDAEQQAAFSAGLGDLVGQIFSSDAVTDGIGDFLGGLF